jgi:hypothetical protein
LEEHAAAITIEPMATRLTKTETVFEYFFMAGAYVPPEPASARGHTRPPRRRPLTL